MSRGTKIILSILLFVCQLQPVVLATQDTDLELVEPLDENAIDDIEESEMSELDDSEGLEDVKDPEEVSLQEVEKVEEYDFKFETIAKNDEAALLIDKSVNNIRLVSLETGNYFDTKVMNGQIGNENVKNAQKSDFTLTYYTDLIKATKKIFDNYTMSIDLDQVEYTTIENGVRCKFTIGDKNKVQLSMFPMYIDKDRMEELVIKHLDTSQRRELLDSSNGYYTETKDRYIRNWESKKKDGTPTQVPIIKLQRMYELFYEIGSYDTEELAKDNAQWQVEEESTINVIEITVEYILEGKDLIVRVPAKEIVTDEKQPVFNLTLNPYLLSGDIFDEGYIFVPDGCGGIINFNTDKISTDVLSIPIYGKDILKNNYFYTEPFTQSTLPVLGIKKNDMAILGIIEEGAEIATVNANIAGKMDEFNKANVTFDLLYMEKAPLTVGSENYVPRYGRQSYDGNIVMRYKLLEGEEANYTGMAKAYKSYLKDKNHLAENSVPENAPLFIDILASVPTEKMLLGIPYTEYTSMTSFEEAQDILETIKEEGIQNIIVQYTDWGNGGARNSPFTDIKILKKIGGEKGFHNLLSYAKEENISIFPQINILSTYSTKGISNSKDISHLIDGTKAVMPNFNIVTKQTNKVKEWLISPGFFSKYITKILKWTDKLGIENLAVDKAGLLLYGDYHNKRQIMRWNALSLFQEALDQLSQGTRLLFSNANSYAYKYASYISDVPTYSSGRRAVDYSVPFVQMVLENDIPYSMEPFNYYSLEGIEKYLLKAIETKSNLKWIFTYRDEELLINAYLSENFNFDLYYQTRFSRWKDKIYNYYQEYNEFYKQVKDAEIKRHQVVNSDLVKVEYTNGCVVYINYGGKTQEIDNVIIEPVSYVIKKQEVQ